MSAEELLCCSKCKAPFSLEPNTSHPRSPYTLPCEHFICQQCIINIQQPQANQKLKCGKCASEIDLSDTKQRQQIMQLDNIVINELAKIAASISEKLTITSTIPKSTAVNKPEQLFVNNDKIWCKNHAMNFQWFCTQEHCQELLCPECIGDNKHMCHHIQKIAQIKDTFSEKLKTIRENHEQDYTNYLKQFTILENESVTLTTTFTDLRNAITSRAQELIKEIKKQETMCLNVIIKNYDKVHLQLEGVKQEAQAVLNFLKNRVDNISKCLQQDCPTDIINLVLSHENNSSNQLTKGINSLDVTNSFPITLQEEFQNKKKMVKNVFGNFGNVLITKNVKKLNLHNVDITSTHLPQLKLILITSSQLEDLDLSENKLGNNK